MACQTGRVREPIDCMSKTSDVTHIFLTIHWMSLEFLFPLTLDDVFLIVFHEHSPTTSYDSYELYEEVPKMGPQNHVFPTRKWHFWIPPCQDTAIMFVLV